MSIAVGIDLGSTFSVVSYVKADGSIEVIPNSEGNRITPSVFAIDNESQILVGDLAADYELTNPDRVVRLVKRKMSDGFNKIYDFNNYDKSIKLSACEISSEILKKLKKDTEDYLGEEITQAVITVPAYFNNSEREATKAAGELAGLKVLRIINEPTAASLAYGLDKNNDSTILVYDLGGGTFDVTILRLSDGCDFHVLSTAGDTKLGGADFDSALGKIIENKLGFEIESSELRSISEKTKKMLSQLQIATVRYAGKQVSVQREEFEKAIDFLIMETKDCIDQALSDAKLSANDINEVVFVGGSTRIPYVAQKVQEWLNKRPNKSINPDEAVSVGAAIQASVLSGNSNKEVYLLDVTPLSLGIETQGGFMTTMIKRNTQVPSEFKEVFTTAIDNQTEVDVKVFQGERPRVVNNHYLGEFKLENIKPAPRGIPKIDVIFDVDANGIVTVRAIDENTNEEKSMVLSGAKSLSNDDITKMLMDAEDNKAKDERDRTIKKLSDYLIDCKIQITHLLSSNVLDKNDINELLDLKKSIENDVHSENIEFLSSLSESAKELLELLSDKVHEEAAKMLS
jgi:molecular chaperone DnaK